jgi:hypothetical protein
LENAIADELKTELIIAKKCAERLGIRIAVTDSTLLSASELQIEIKQKS